MALVDIVFNIGKQGFINEFKILPVALLNRDWKSAQPQSSRRGISSARNNAVAALFDQAIMTEKFYISIAQADERKRLIFQPDGSLKPIKI